MLEALYWLIDGIPEAIAWFVILAVVWFCAWIIGLILENRRFDKEGE